MPSVTGTQPPRVNMDNVPKIELSSDTNFYTCMDTVGGDGQDNTAAGDVQDVRPLIYGYYSKGAQSKGAYKPFDFDAIEQAAREEERLRLADAELKYVNQARILTQQTCKLALTQARLNVVR